MSVLVREDVAKERVAVPVKLTAAFPVPSDMVQRSYYGMCIKHMADIWPYAHLRRATIEAAKQWVEHMRLQEFDLLDGELDLKLWGPYRAKSQLYRAATSYQDSEEPFPDGTAKMLLTGNFLARKQYAVEV